MSLVQERERRPNAGSRMRALLDQEVDMEELFEYRDSDEEDEEFSTQAVEEEEEDKVDSDFDLDSSEGEQEHIEEGEAMDKELDKAEKRARRAATFNPPPSAAAAKPRKPTTIDPEKKPSEKRKRRSRSTTMDQDEKGGERSTRFSSRKNTVLNRQHVEDQLRRHEKRRALLPKRDRPVINKLTQEELLAEAAITEEINRDSLLEWQQMEAERKANAKKKDKRGIFGQFVRYYSFAENDGPVLRNDSNPADDNNNEAAPTTEISHTAATQSNMEADTTMTDANGPDWQISSNADLMGRNLISFMDNSIAMDAQQQQQAYPLYGKRSGAGGTDADKDLENADLIDQLSDWLVRPSKPNRPVICPITGEVAKYKDPSTGIPYANITAYQVIRACLHHEMRWAPASGIYLGYIPSAKGVPEGWDAAI
ncbi:YL1 nuclear family DNA-binding protein [Mucor lusitanicus]|nr:YL1 nuclear family DNA-binding protein [Mucor lusitanicus]